MSVDTKELLERKKKGLHTINIPITYEARIVSLAVKDKEIELVIEQGKSNLKAVQGVTK